MITVEEIGDSFAVRATTRAPAVFLDHCGLRVISSDGSHRKRFLGCFESVGTLLFSWAHMLELSGNSGASADRIRSLLEGIGANWFPLEVNPFKVLERETHGGENDESPCAGTGFLYNYYPHVHGGPLSLSAVVRLAQDPEIRGALTAVLEGVKSDVSQVVLSVRARARDLPGKEPFDRRRPAATILSGLSRILLKGAFNFNANDSVDFFHAAGALVCGDMVLLDKRWADFARQVGVPKDYTRVYTPRQIVPFLDDLENLT
jgi:hypothetical protein